MLNEVFKFEFSKSIFIRGGMLNEVLSLSSVRVFSLGVVCLTKS